MKRVQFLSVVVLIAALLLAGCSGAILSFAAAPRLAQIFATPTPLAPINVDASTNASTNTTAPVAASSALAAFQSTLEDIYTQVGPSVVNISVVMGPSNTAASPFGNSPFGQPQQQGVQEALGSGFVWDAQGHIITNNHVVSGATQITVTFSDGSTFDAKLVGADPNSDLAVIQVNAPANLLRPVTLANSSQVKVGELAIAIGNPFGLSGTMTQGIVSALSRSLPVGSDTAQSTGPTYTIPDIIQTDAAINPGNSGGVLVDAQGQVIGVTAAIRSSTNSNSGIGFVIPSNIVNRVVPSLIQTGRYDHPYMGISGTDLTRSLATAMKLDPNQKGVMVVDVAAGSPAAQAGLQGSNTNATISGQNVVVGGDVITGVEGQTVSGFDDLTSYLFNHTQVGQTITLTILRQGRAQTVQLTLGALPSQSVQ